MTHCIFINSFQACISLLKQGFSTCQGSEMKMIQVTTNTPNGAVSVLSHLVLSDHYMLIIKPSRSQHTAKNRPFFPPTRFQVLTGFYTIINLLSAKEFASLIEHRSLVPISRSQALSSSFHYQRPLCMKKPSPEFFNELLDTVYYSDHIKCKKKRLTRT